MRASKYDAATLAPLVAESRTTSELLRKLGLRPTGGNYRHISRCLRIAGVDTSHFRQPRHPIVRRDELEVIVREARSYAEVCARLGRPTVGRPVHDLKGTLRRFGLDTSHFKGQAWARGLSASSNESLSRGLLKRVVPDEVVFRENSPAFISSKNLARRLIAKGRLYLCEWCGLDSWRDQRLVLHIDHINGINNDNRLENLRFLCPLCHSQTPTYGNRRR
ncbi:MAG TPA: HNH endonuclease signature motif containing protein [Kofleriaceae bacterium]|jgi:hypothetical protein